jgi:hypothetical protein
MTAEGIAGMEKRTPRIQNDLTIPYVRNIMGPASYTVIKFDRSLGSHAYQMGQAVVYEAGIQIYAERHDRILGFAGADFLKHLPANWDDIKFLEGLPESHAIYARRKGNDWYLGGITNQARTATIPLSFLVPGVAHTARIYRDGASATEMTVETRTLGSTDVLSIPMRALGGFAVFLDNPITTPIRISPKVDSRFGSGARAIRVSLRNGVPTGGWEGLLGNEKAWLSLYDLSGSLVAESPASPGQRFTGFRNTQGTFMLKMLPRSGGD